MITRLACGGNGMTLVRVLAASCEELCARTGNPPLVISFSVGKSCVGNVVSTDCSRSKDWMHVRGLNPQWGLRERLQQQLVTRSYFLIHFKAWSPHSAESADMQSYKQLGINCRFKWLGAFNKSKKNINCAQFLTHGMRYQQINYIFFVEKPVSPGRLHWSHWN
jgi:hypothetical protein